MKMNKLRISGMLLTEAYLLRAMRTFTLLGLLILITSCSTYSYKWYHISRIGEEGFTHIACSTETERSCLSLGTVIEVSCRPADVLEDVWISIEIRRGDPLYREEVYDSLSFYFRIYPWADDAADREMASITYLGNGNFMTGELDVQSNVIDIMWYWVDGERTEVISLPIEAHSGGLGEPYYLENQGAFRYPAHRFQLNNMEGTNFLKDLMKKGASDVSIGVDPNNIFLIEPVNSWLVSRSSEFSLSRASAAIGESLDECGIDIEDL